MSNSIGTVTEVVHDNIVLDVVLLERLTDRGGLVNADLEGLESRIVQILEIQVSVSSRGQHESGAVQRRGAQYALCVTRQVEHEVALICGQSSAGLPALDSGPVVVLHSGVERLGDHLRDLLLVTFASVVRKRHVAGVGANS